MTMVNLVIVPEGITWDNIDLLRGRGVMQTLAEADYVVTTDGTVLKDRHLELNVEVVGLP